MGKVRRLIGWAMCSSLCLLFGGWGIAQTSSRDTSGSAHLTVSRPIPGKVIVSIFQGEREADYFSTRGDGTVATRFNLDALSRLQSYGINNARKGFQRGNNATYELTFGAEGREDEIVSYLRSLPNVRYAQRDYTVEFFAEPNDFFYQPDSTNPLGHWIPDTMNVMFQNIGRGRTCVHHPRGPYDYTECCTADSLWYHTFQLRDALHLSDNWYLQKIRVNKAWDIEKGSPTVKIMIMDSGIAIEHPDLAANIWSNPDGDPEGDWSNDGVPGIKGQDIDNDGGKGFNDPDIGASDANSNGRPLWGDDHIADCGPDGDYGFGRNGIDDPPPGPGGGDDDTVKAGPNNDPWDDNLRGPGSLHPELPFDDDMGDVVLMKNDDNEDGYADDFCGLNFYDPWNGLVPRENGCPNYLNYFACHGTEMAGIVGAVTNNTIGMAGMAWYCKLVPAKIAVAYPESSPAGPTGSIIPIARALYYAIDRGIDIVNMSFGVDGPVWDQATINEAIDAAYAHGIVMLAGAGNDYQERYYYPASNPKVICLSGVNRLDHEAHLNYTHRVDLCGVVSDPQRETKSICSDEDLGQNHDCYDRGAEAIVTAYLTFPQPTFNIYDPSLPYGYAVCSLATSGTTAQASGLAALLVSFYNRTRFHDMFPDSIGDPPYARFIKRELLRGCMPITFADKTHEGMLGAGRMDAYRSLTQWGTITENAIWNDHVYVSGDLTIAPGKTLTIQPGTTVYFAPEDDRDSGIDPARVAFEVQGTLIANGTASHPIVFKSFAGSPGPEDWYGIWFKQGSSGSLAHCRIENARYGLKHDSSISINSCEIVWAQYAHVWRDLTIDPGLILTVNPGTTVYFAPEDTSHTYPDTARVALEVKGVLNANGTANNRITFKSGSDEPFPGDWFGIYFSDENASGTLSHCKIQDANYGVESKATIHIADCEIMNCLTAGVYMWDTVSVGDVVNNSSTIERCNIHFNPDGAGMRIWNCPDTVHVESDTTTNNDVGIWVSNARPRITSSVMSGNTNQGVWVTSYRYPYPYPYPDIEWCKMQGNYAEGIKCEYNAAKVSYSKSWQNSTYGVLATGADADPSIDHSKMIDNSSAGVRVESGAHVILGIAGVGGTGNNSIYGSQAKNVYNATTTAVYAQNCWWGSNPPNTSKFQGQVIYTPYLTSDPVYYLAPAKPKMPTVLSLEQNFPNPFIGANGSTTIMYSIPSQTDRVVLRVYDVAGRHVRTLVDGPHIPGYYSVRWDGRNDRGKSVAPGVYFCQMNAGKQLLTKKMVLFR